VRAVPRVKLPLGSLRARLLASFAVLIAITLVCAGSAVVWLVQSYRREVAVAHLQDLALSTAGAAVQLERLDAQPEEIAQYLANQVRVPSALVLVTDPQGQVLAEQGAGSTSSSTTPAFAGRTLKVPATPGAPGAPGAPGSPASAAVPGAPAGSLSRGGGGAGGGPPGGAAAAGPAVWSETAGGSRYVFVSGYVPALMNQGGPPRGQGRFPLAGRTPQYRVILAVPYGDLAGAWRELALGLGGAAAVAAIAAAVVAWYLAQSIARPLRQITHAAERIAGGDYGQTIAVSGSDEVVQLGRVFNRMSHEVDRSHRSLRDFVANASHELRTPLTSIEGFSQAFTDGFLEEPDEIAHAASVISEESKRMRHLVDGLLRLSQIEASDGTPRRDRVDVARLLHEAVDRIERQASQRELDVQVSVPLTTDTLVTLGNASELEQLFGNLIENAAKYSPKGARITVSGRTTGGELLVDVHNTGSVIPPEDLPRIFERFYRVDRSRARDAGDVEGNGLGLAIAHEVATRHGGTLSARSDAASGTTFSVTLPRVTPDLAAQPKPDPHLTIGLRRLSSKTSH
jgi:signal transduction histidine kinase